MHPSQQYCMRYSLRLANHILVLACLLCVDVSATANCPRIENDQARACCERSFPESAMQQSVRMAVIDDHGTISNLAAALYWKRFKDGKSRTRVDLTEPPRQSGTVVLLTERETLDDGQAAEPEVVVYKPSERRDRLLTISALSGEMFGTDFSYEDFAHFYGADMEMHISRLDDLTIDGRVHTVLESKPKDIEAAFERGASYTRVVTHLDAQRCVATLTQFFEEDDELRKELIANQQEIIQIGDRWVPHEMTMYDRLEESKTVLTVESIEFDPKLKDRFFERSSLKR